MDKLLNKEALLRFVDVEQRQNRIPVVFVLDTSSSMRGEGFAQLKKAFVSIIQEYLNQSIVDHFVAVITFGRDVKVLQHYSNDNKALLHILDDIVCEGPSQLGKALQLALSVFVPGMIGCMIGPFSISPNLVIISSGNVSSNDRARHSEDCRYEKTNIVRMFEQNCEKQPLICVPVGSSPDTCFLASIAYASKIGKLLNVDEAAQYGRYSTNMVIASETIGSVPTTYYTVNDVRTAVKTRMGSQITSEKDIEDIYEILTNRHAYEMNSYQMEDLIESELHAEGDPRLPPIGTRVRKGPNWPFLYTGQDSNVCGTVIGHSDAHLNISVEWDTDMIFPYHFDTNHHQSNVVVCDEPRILQRENIAVGCLVERGPDWKWLDQDGGKNNIGSVYRVNKNNTVHVRWPNGTKSNYRFGYDGKYDVSICDPFDNSIMGTFKERQSSWHKENSKTIASNDGIINRDWTVKVTSYSARAIDTDVRKKSENQVKTCNNITEKNKPSDEAVINSRTIQTKKGSSSEGHWNTDSKTSPNSSFWEWKTKQGRWISFPKSENEKIQNAFKKNRKGTVLVNINEDLYRVVFSKMIQINICNRESHEIRRLS